MSVLLARSGRVSIRLPGSRSGPLPNNVSMIISRTDGLPTVLLEQDGEVVHTFFDAPTAMIKQTQTADAPPELLLRGRHTLLRLTSLLVQTADGAVEEGTYILFDRIASGLPPMPLRQSINALKDQIGQILRPTRITALFLIDDVADEGSEPVLAYVAEGRTSVGFGGFLEAARIGAITGRDFRWEPRYTERTDRCPGATPVWTRRS